MLVGGVSGSLGSVFRSLSNLLYDFQPSLFPSLSVEIVKSVDVEGQMKKIVAMA